jgi:hypothetical protein
LWYLLTLEELGVVGVGGVHPIHKSMFLDLPSLFESAHTAKKCLPGYVRAHHLLAHTHMFFSAFSTRLSLSFGVTN